MISRARGVSSPIDVKLHPDSTRIEYMRKIALNLLFLWLAKRLMMVLRWIFRKALVRV